MVSPSLTERQELEMDSSVRKRPVMRYTIAQIPPGDVYLIWSHTIDSYRQPSAARIYQRYNDIAKGWRLAPVQDASVAVQLRGAAEARRTT